MPEGEVPSAKALLVNSTSIDLLNKGNYSHYDFLGKGRELLKQYIKALFIGWSNLNFDRRMFHFNFFKGNRYPYNITHYLVIKNTMVCMLQESSNFKS